MFGRKKLRGIERLEGKELLACDVTFAGGVLDIACDGEDDLVNVFGFGGILSVDTGDGLVPVGAASDLTDLNIDSGDGDDNVVLTTVDPSGDVDIDTGKGNDRVVMSLVNVGGDLDIRTEKGDDRVTFIGTSVGESVDVNTGKGDDTIEVLPFIFAPGLTAGDDIKLDGKQGTDTLLGQSNIVVGDDLDIRRFEVFA